MASKHSIIPTRCFWCEIGEIVAMKCLTCGATYGARNIKKKKKKGFVLPSVREANPEHIEKNLRDKITKNFRGVR